MWHHTGPSDDEFRDEIESHIAIETDRLVAEGLTPTEAAAQARRTFGNSARVRERFYESRRLRWLDDVMQDARFSLRSLRRSPGFAAIAILMLAVGLGANAAIFSVVNTVLLRPLPYANPDQLVLVENSELGRSPEWLTNAWRARAHNLSGLAGFAGPEPATLSARGGPAQVAAARVTSNFLGLLGAAPSIGRTFRQGDPEPASPSVAVLTHSFWRSRFGAAPSVVGQSITVTDAAGSEPLVIIGVLRQDFRFPAVPPSRPTLLNGETQPDIIRVAGPDDWLQVVGRLSPTATAAVASTELQGIFLQAGSDVFRPDFLQRNRVVATPLQERLVGNVKSRLLLLMGAVGCVLLVVCANVTNLQLARASTHQPEYAVRSALGAGSGRLARMILTESVVLNGLGALASLPLAYWTGEVTHSMIAGQMSQLGAIAIDGRVIAFTAVLALVTALLGGVASIGMIRSSIVTGNLANGGRRSTTGRMRLRRGLLTAEVAVTFVLVITAALLSQTLSNLYRTKRGFEGDRVVTAGVMPNMSGTIPELQSRSSLFFNDLTQQISSLPGVVSAAAAANVPFSGLGAGVQGVSIVGRPATPKAREWVNVSTVTPGYFVTMGTRLLSGRGISDTDLDGRPRVAVVNDALAQRIAANQPLVGAQIAFGRNLVTVVGIVEDMPDTSLREPASPFIYLPLAQTIGSSYAFGRLTILARTQDARPESLIPAIRKAIWAVGSDVIIDDIATMNGRLAASVRTERDSALLFSLLAAIALFVAIAGVYGVVSYSVAQQTREIGIRIALGAGFRQIVGEIIRVSIGPIVLGLALGIGGAVTSTRVFASMLFGTRPTDPATFVAATLVLAMTGLLAAWIPARRATRIDPATALRAE